MPKVNRCAVHVRDNVRWFERFVRKGTLRRSKRFHEHNNLKLIHFLWCLSGQTNGILHKENSSQRWIIQYLSACVFWMRHMTIPCCVTCSWVEVGSSNTFWSVVGSNKQSCNRSSKATLQGTYLQVMANCECRTGTGRRFLSAKTGNEVDPKSRTDTFIRVMQWNILADGKWTADKI